MDIKNVVVAGGGVLGSQIAFQAAYKGFNVKVWLRMESSIGRAKPKFERVEQIYLETLQAMKTKPAAYCRGLADSPELSEAQIDELIEHAAHAMERIEFTLSHEEAAKDADLVIEAIAENPTEKVEFYQTMAQYYCYQFLYHASECICGKHWTPREISSTAFCQRNLEKQYR